MLRGLHDTKVRMIHAAIGYWPVDGLAVVAALLLARWLRRDRLAPPLAFGH
nr:hypothetical protein [Mesorhizobium sp. M7A.F.Ca.US.006.01.1.1]